MIVISKAIKWWFLYFLQVNFITTISVWIDLWITTTSVVQLGLRVDLVGNLVCAVDIGADLVLRLMLLSPIGRHKGCYTNWRVSLATHPHDVELMLTRLIGSTLMDIRHMSVETLVISRAEHVWVCLLVSRIFVRRSGMVEFVVKPHTSNSIRHVSFVMAVIIH